MYIHKGLHFSDVIKHDVKLTIQIAELSIINFYVIRQISSKSFLHENQRIAQVDDSCQSSVKYQTSQSQPRQKPLTPTASPKNYLGISTTRAHPHRLRLLSAQIHLPRFLPRTLRPSPISKTPLSQLYSPNLPITQPAHLDTTYARLPTPSREYPHPQCRSNSRRSKSPSTTRWTMGYI